MSDQPHNPDDFAPTVNGRGLDVSTQYTDDLDRVCCIHIASLSGKHVKTVDLGGGKGGHSIRMADLGADVLMIDVADMASTQFGASVTPGKISFLLKDFKDLAAGDVPDQFDVLYSQRALHYLPYNDAKKCLSLMFNRMAQGGAVFISVAGMGSEFGATYPHRALPVEQRFSVLAHDMQTKFNTREPLVLYQQDEVKDLLARTGFSNISFIHSNFGQIRAVARKP